LFRDRRKWLRDTRVTKDPRRVPVATAEENARIPGLVIRNGRIFDGCGTEPFSADVYIEGDRIRAVDKRVPLDQQVQQIDASGMTVMPGLVDLHTHLSYHEPDIPAATAQSVADGTLRALERMRFYVESGITSVRDAGSHADIPFRLKEWERSGRINGPRVFAAGPLITGTGGHGAERLDVTSPALGKVREASGPTDWREAVRGAFKAGADVIKVASHFSAPEVQAAVDEAHALGLRVMCDAETHYIEWAIEAGVDTIEHPLPRTDDAIAMMAKAGVFAVPTLIPYVIIFDERGGYFDSTSRRFAFSKEDNLEVVARMHRSGVRFGIGTDLVMDWFRYLPHAYITELELMMEAGLDREEVLEAATLGGATALDMQDQLGSIECGKLADIILVEGEPDRNLRDLAQLHTVIRDGRIEVYEGQSLVPRCRAKAFPGVTPEDI